MMKRNASRTVLAIVTMVAASMMAGNSYADLFDGLVNYWPLEGFEDLGPASTVPDDLSPSDPGNLGTTYNFVTDDPGTPEQEALFGQALSMWEGEADGHLVAAPSADTVGAWLAGDMSISIWTRATEWVSSWQAMIAHGEGGGFRLHRRGGEDTAAWTAGSNGDTPVGGPNIGPGTGWHHYVATLEGGTTSSLYVDGVLAATHGSGTPEDRGNGVHIGFNPDTSGREWHGQIDDVGMWNRALNPEEVAAIHQQGLDGNPLLGGDTIILPFLPLPSHPDDNRPPLPGPSGGAGFWGVREVRDNGTIGALRESVDSLINGGGTIVDGRFDHLDVTDPDTTPAGGPVLSGDPFPFLSNSPGEDTDISSVAKGTVRVVQDGDYTIQMRSDGGAAVRIVGQAWDSIHGRGFIDGEDPSTIAFIGDTTDTDMRGVINLAAGDYDFEVVSFQRNGPAFYELTSAMGVHPEVDTAQWIAVGDPTSIPEQEVARVANQLIDQNHIDEAVGYLHRIVERLDGETDEDTRRDLGDTWYVLGILQGARRQPQEARTALSNARELLPHDVRVRGALGKLLLKMGEFGEAAQELAAAVEIDPDNLELHQHLGVALVQLGRLDEAVSVLEKVVTANPRNAPARYFLGNAKRRLGRFEEAMEAYRETLAVAPKLLEAANNLAWILSAHPDGRLRSGEEALALAERLCQVSRFKEPRFLDTLAVAYAENGQFEKATEAAQKALDIYRQARRGDRAGGAEQGIRQRLTLFEQGQPYREKEWAAP